MNTPNALRPVRHGEEGFTLLEVLIAMLVLSIGLLGIGKLMMLSARANDSSYMRTQATALGYTILDAMRANRQAALVQGYDIAMGVVPAAVVCTVAAPCNSGQQAQNDLSLWVNSLAVSLPQGQGSVVTATVPAPGGGGANEVTATITVQWSDKVAEQSFGAPAGNLISITLETVL